MKVSMTVCYDGTNYRGFQMQKNGITVQQRLEEAIFAATGSSVRVTGSGRTDAGVHALGQVCHFIGEFSVPPERFAKALNVHLPPDIRVLQSCAADENFHACFSAKKKTYRYRMYRAETEVPLCERYAVRIPLVDFEKMSRAAGRFIGTHDFSAFCAAGSSVKTTTRTVYSSKLTEKREPFGEIYEFEVCGNGFLYNQVRIMAGALVEIGRGKLTEEGLESALGGGSRDLLGKTMPARGLVLWQVEYR